MGGGVVVTSDDRPLVGGWQEEGGGLYVCVVSASTQRVSGMFECRRRGVGEGGGG